MIFLSSFFQGKSFSLSVTYMFSKTHFQIVARAITLGTLYAGGQPSEVPTRQGLLEPLLPLSACFCLDDSRVDRPLQVT